MTIKNTHIRGEMPDSGLIQLPQWGLILIEGSDAASFLQNQLTNSVLGLKSSFYPQIARGHDEVRLVGYCSPKGRLLASAWLGLFPVNADGEDRFALFITKDIAAGIAKRLAMYVLRSKVKVVDASSDWQVSGYFHNASDTPMLEDDEFQMALALPDVLFEGQSYRRTLFAQLNTSNAQSNKADLLNVWNDLEVISAIPRIVATTQEQFVPQMINFESVLGVDFKKGCYPGQEIVARSQYRGVIKRRLQLAHVSSDEMNLEIAQPGVELFHSLDPSQPAGMVVLSAPNALDSRRIDLQVECKLDALENGSIHLGSPDGPVLKIDLLPYPLIEI
jgi:folate-binding protein YgfZ